MKLKKLARSGSSAISLIWDDGHEGTVSLRSLRNSCPCAGCQGETVLLHHYGPPQKAPDNPEAYSLQSVQVVGNYAMKLTWGDGHDQGIYTWEHLRSLCECDACQRANAASPEERPTNG